MSNCNIYGIISGNEDFNDQDDLRRDEVFKVLAGRGNDLAWSSTLCRFENSTCRDVCVEISKIFVEKFIESFKTPPSVLVRLMSLLKKEEIPNSASYRQDAPKLMGE